MSTLKFRTLTVDEFEAFAAAHPAANFLQSSSLGERRRVDGWAPHYVGLVDAKGTIQAAAYLAARPVLFGLKEFECQQGPLMDYSDKDLAQQFLREITRYTHTSGGIRVLLLPYVLATHRDNQGEIIADDYDATPVIKLFTDTGYRHLDTTRTDHNPVWNRWYFVKDLSDIPDSDALMESFAQQTRWSVRKSQKSGVRVRQIGEDELAEFESILEATAQRRGFANRQHNYFTSMLQHFPDDRIYFMLADLPFDDYQQSLQELIDTEDATIAKIPEDATDKKQRTARRVAIEAKGHYQKKLAESQQLRTEHGDTLPLAAALFIRYGNEMVYLFSGSDPAHSSFCAPYALQWFAQNEAIKHACSRYNFYGTKGNFNGFPDQEGILQFKRGFGGVIEEQLGCFEYRTRRFICAVVDRLRAARS